MYLAFLQIQRTGSWFTLWSWPLPACFTHIYYFHQIFQNNGLSCLSSYSIRHSNLLHTIDHKTCTPTQQQPMSAYCDAYNMIPIVGLMDKTFFLAHRHQLSFSRFTITLIRSCIHVWLCPTRGNKAGPETYWGFCFCNFTIFALKEFALCISSWSFCCSFLDIYETNHRNIYWHSKSISGY